MDNKTFKGDKWLDNVTLTDEQNIYDNIAFSLKKIMWLVDVTLDKRDVYDEKHPIMSSDWRRHK